MFSPLLSINFILRYAVVHMQDLCLLKQLCCVGYASFFEKVSMVTFAIRKRYQTGINKITFGVTTFVQNHLKTCFSVS